MSPLVFLPIWHLKSQAIKLSPLPLGRQFSSLQFSIQKPSALILSLNMPFLHSTPLKSLTYHQSSPFMPFTSFKYLQITKVSLLSLLIPLYLRQSEFLFFSPNASRLPMPSVVALGAPSHLSLFLQNARQMLTALACLLMLFCTPSKTALPAPRCRVLMPVQPRAVLRVSFRSRASGARLSL